MENKETNLMTVVASKIFDLRGWPVMMDRDIAELYGVETKVLKQAVRRNIDRFPPDFMMQMTKDELENWRSQNVTSNSKAVIMGLRYNPFCFTEQGVAMLSSVLRSPKAIAVNIQIIRSFVVLRKEIGNYQDLFKQVEELQRKGELRDQSISKIVEYLRQFDSIKKRKNPPPNERRRIGFKP